MSPEPPANFNIERDIPGHRPPESRNRLAEKSEEGVEVAGLAKPALELKIEPTNEKTFLVARVKNEGAQAVFWAVVNISDISDGDIGLLNKPLVWHHHGPSPRLEIAAGGMAALRIAEVIESTRFSADGQSPRQIAEWEVEYLGSDGKLTKGVVSEASVVSVVLLAHPPLRSPCRVEIRLYEDGTVGNLSNGTSFQASPGGKRITERSS